MKSAVFAAALLMVGCFSLPISAQQQDLQEVMNAANALSARESELLGKKDAAGIASLFTSDALLVMLAPQFAFKPGRDAIQKHYQGIIDAGATRITVELKNLELRGNDGVWAAGTYSVTIKDKTIQGNWFRILEARQRELEDCYGSVRSRRCYRCSTCRGQFLTSTHRQQIEQRREVLDPENKGTRVFSEHLTGADFYLNANMIDANEAKRLRKVLQDALKSLEDTTLNK